MNIDGLKNSLEKYNKEQEEKRIAEEQEKKKQEAEKKKKKELHIQNMESMLDEYNLSNLSQYTTELVNAINNITDEDLQELMEQIIIPNRDEENILLKVYIKNLYLCYDFNDISVFRQHKRTWEDGSYDEYDVEFYFDTSMKLNINNINLVSIIKDTISIKDRAYIEFGDKDDPDYKKIDKWKRFFNYLQEKYPNFKYEKEVNDKEFGNNDNWIIHSSRETEEVIRYTKFFNITEIVEALEKRLTDFELKIVNTTIEETNEYSEEENIYIKVKNPLK